MHQPPPWLQYTHHNPHCALEFAPGVKHFRGEPFRPATYREGTESVAAIAPQGERRRDGGRAPADHAPAWGGGCAQAPGWCGAPAVLPVVVQCMTLFRHEHPRGPRPHTPTTHHGPRTTSHPPNWRKPSIMNRKPFPEGGQCARNPGARTEWWQGLPLPRPSPPSPVPRPPQGWMPWSRGFPSRILSVARTPPYTSRPHSGALDSGRGSGDRDGQGGYHVEVRGPECSDVA